MPSNVRFILVLHLFLWNQSSQTSFDFFDRSLVTGITIGATLTYGYMKWQQVQPLQKQIDKLKKQHNKDQLVICKQRETITEIALTHSKQTEEYNSLAQNYQTLWNENYWLRQIVTQQSQHTNTLIQERSLLYNKINELSTPPPMSESAKKIYA